MDQLDILIGKELKSLRISNKKSMQTVADHAGKAKSVKLPMGKNIIKRKVIISSFVV